MEHKISEFYLRYYIVNNPVYRVALGELMPAMERRTFPPQEKYEGDCQTGSIGFMDSIICDEFVPNRDNSNYIKIKALSIIAIGIEPAFQGSGNGGILVEHADVLAKARGIETIVINTLKGDTQLPGICERRGYHLYVNNGKAVKRF